MKTLPKYWAVKIDKKSPLLPKFKAWCHERFSYFVTDFNLPYYGCYPDFYGFTDIHIRQRPEIKVFTLEGWDDIVSEKPDTIFEITTLVCKNCKAIWHPNEVACRRCGCLTSEAKKETLSPDIPTFDMKDWEDNLKAHVCKIREYSALVDEHRKELDKGVKEMKAAFDKYAEYICNQIINSK